MKDLHKYLNEGVPRGANNKTRSFKAVRPSEQHIQEAIAKANKNAKSSVGRMTIAGLI